MAATLDDVCNKLDKIINLLQGMYSNQDEAETIKNSSNVKTDAVKKGQ